MKQSIYIALMLITTTACQQKNFDTQKLNGYWEIEKVILANGTEKEFTINKVVDFIEISGTTGKRSKVNPKLDGTFETNKDADAFTIVSQDNNTFIRFKTPYIEWDETLVKLNDSQYVIKNKDNNTYYYKRFEPFNFE